MLSNQLAIGTKSLGQHDSHLLDRKIKAAAGAGYAGVEIVYSDIELYSQYRALSILEGAEDIKAICDQNNLDIVSLAPFCNYEGERSPLEERLQAASHWIEVARILHATYLQVPSQFHPEAIGDSAVITAELQQLADLASASQPFVSIAYEYVSWGAYNSTWQTTLRLVEAVNRPNFGLCLDTFHEVTKLWASPFTQSGKYQDADRDLQKSLREFVSTCPLEKIFYVQLSDGERFDPPFSKEHAWYSEDESPLLAWSRNARPFPFEQDFGAYMPITEVAKAWILDTGFKGWVSFEIFDHRMHDEYYKPEDAAIRGIKSWEKLQEEVESV